METINMEQTETKHATPSKKERLTGVDYMPNKKTARLKKVKY